MDTFIKRMLLLLTIIASFIPVLVSGASSEQFSNVLYAGQSNMYTVDVPCSATIVMSGPIGTVPFLYAKKADSSWIPSSEYVMDYSDVSSTDSTNSQKINLDKGKWFVVGQAQKGFGEYAISIDKSCPLKTGCFGGQCTNLVDCVMPEKYLEDDQTGFLRTGESKIYPYLISGNRSYIEWILTGPCGSDAPVIRTSFDLDKFTTVNCGEDFDLYVYKGCNPKYYPCTAIAADTGAGSNAYIGLVNPEKDTVYYIKIYSKHGRGEYQLTTRSYTESNITIAGINTNNYSGFVATESDVNAPDDLNKTVPVPPNAYSVRSIEI